jgi:hypothetical protein
MKHARAPLLRQSDGTRTVGGKPAFEFVTGRRTDKLPSFFREKLVDCAGVLLLNCLAGENDSPAVNLAVLESGRVIGVMDEVAKFVGVNRSIWKERGQHDRRPPDHLPVDDDETAR